MAVVPCCFYDNLLPPYGRRAQQFNESLFPYGHCAQQVYEIFTSVWPLCPARTQFLRMAVVPTCSYVSDSVWPLCPAIESRSPYGRCAQPLLNSLWPLCPFVRQPVRCQVVTGVESNRCLISAPVGGTTGRLVTANVSKKLRMAVVPFSPYGRCAQPKGNHMINFPTSSGKFRQKSVYMDSFDFPAGMLRLMRMSSNRCCGPFQMFSSPYGRCAQLALV